MLLSREKFKFNQVLVNKLFLIKISKTAFNKVGKFYIQNMAQNKTISV